MRNLLRHYAGLELEEADVFGLGAGLDLFLIETAAVEPGVLVFGRSATLEQDAAAALGIDYREQTVDDDDEAWAEVRAEVLADRPTMLSGDIFYLDFRNYKVHFPAHRFVIVGFDDTGRIAYIADRVDPEPQPCSYDALRRSRNPRDFLSTHNLWGRFVDPKPRRSLEEATRLALDRCAERMLASTFDPTGMGGGLAGAGEARVTEGLAALERLREHLPTWPDRSDRKFVASYASRSLEKFGNGGGNFRRLYAAFLATARERAPDRVAPELPARMTASADAWTELSVQLAALAEGSEPAGDLLTRCDRLLARILDLERGVFEALLPG